jgi:hypothetical protein
VLGGAAMTWLPGVGAILFVLAVLFLAGCGDD